MKTIGNGLVPVRNPVPPRSAFASARLMALRRLVAGRALDFQNVSQGLPYQRHVLFVNHGHHIMKYVLLALPHQLQWYPPQLVTPESAVVGKVR